MAQQGYGPPSLPVGTEVSAKYRGAFCEAKVKSVTKSVKCRVQMKDSQVSVQVPEDEIKGTIKVGALVELKHPTTGIPVEAIIHKLVDQSAYTVVFDDGDERTLRRSQLCLKGDKHFIESETLDNLPLSHPEHFGTPVLGKGKGKRKMDDDEDDDVTEEESPRRTVYRGRHQELVGKLFLVDLPQRKGSAIPALVVLPDSNSIGEVKKPEQILVRSFKDSKYMTVIRKHLKEFTRDVAIKNEDKTMRTAFEKALLYFDTKELPVGWKREDMLGSDIEDDEVVEDNEYASEDEPYEEKDRFVAQLYKFMDDRGTPINKGPCIANKDLNLYKLFKIVQNYGGYNKVTKEMKWAVVYCKMGLPSIHQNPAHQVKSAYKKYLDAYETFYRKLGNTMGTSSRPGRVRHNSGRSILNYRSREKSPRQPKPQSMEKKEEQASPKPKGEASPKPKGEASPKPKVEAPPKPKAEAPPKPKAEASPKPKIDASDKSEDNQDSGSTASTDELDLVTRRTTQRRDRSLVVKEKEESKEKKDDNSKMKEKKDDVQKAKKEEVPATKVKKDEIVTPVSKCKKDELASKVKKDDAGVKKEERKSVRKVVKAEEEKDDKDEKKPMRTIRKEKEEAEVVDSPKKRLTRRKLMSNDPVVKKGVESKEEVTEEKKEPAKKVAPKELRLAVVDKKEKEIPRTLERRDSKTLEKKIVSVKVVDMKAQAEKKAPVKAVEEKKPVKREKKGKETEKEEEVSEGDDEDSSEDQKQERPSSAKLEYPIGSKLRVKYGKGKNQKMYIAKVVDMGTEGPHRTYLVHYAGWNNRYDEWIRGERVASLLDKPGANKAGVDKPDMPKTTDIPKTGLKVLKPLTSSLKRLTHRTPILTKKANQIFRTPKLLNTKTRATRSSSGETSGGQAMSKDKRTTRRRSIVDAGDEKAEDNQGDEKDEKSDSDDKHQVSAKGDGVEESQHVNIEDEDGEDNSSDKKDLETSTEEDSEEVEEAMEEADNKDVTQPEDLKDEVKDKLVKDLELKEEDKESVSLKDEVKSEQEEASTEESSDQCEEDLDKASTLTGIERASVMVSEVITADSEITAMPDEVEDESKEECSSDEPTVLGTEKEVKDGLDRIEADMGSENVILSSEDLLKMGAEASDVAKKADSQASVDDEEEDSSDRSIPLLKKVDVDVVDRKDVDRSKMGKGRKKDTGKDAKKSVKTTPDAPNLAAEIPTLEPIIMSSEPPIEKSSPSPYDFDEADNESQWQPEISKKWDVMFSDQTPRSKEGTPVSDVTDKEKKKVKKKLKKKMISSPQHVSESKLDVSNSSQPVECVSSTAEVSVNEEDRLAEKGQKKKGRKRKDLSGEIRPDAVQKYESSVSSVVESDKHSLREESPERESKPAAKKRRLKRASESDKKELGRAFKPERRRGLRDSQDTVEALNVEGSKGKSVVHEQSLMKDVAMLKASQSKESCQEMNSAAIVSEKSETKEPVEEVDDEASANSGTQPFIPQASEEIGPSNAHYENTPPTTPEHEEGEGGSTLSSQQPQTCASPCSDDLQLKVDSLKDGSSSSSSSISLPASSSQVKSAGDSPSDNDVGSTTSNDNMDTALTINQSSESSGAEQEHSQSRKRKPVEEPPAVSLAKKKKRIHGTRSRTAKKSPKYISTDSVSYQTRVPETLVSSTTGASNHYLESPLSRLADLTKSPRPSKYNFNADLGEYLEGEERCNFLIAKMKEIKAIYINLKSEVASIDRRRKRIRRKEREFSQASPSERDSVR